MALLYSYCIPFDDGAAPNPFWGLCTLAICKPVIRRVADIGDWVVGTGSKNSPIGDISTSVVYAMKITQKMSMKDYDKYCKEEFLEKIPDWNSSDYRKRLGDCIYDFSVDPPILRKSVHSMENMEKDLRGKNVLLSTHYYYFGDTPVKLPENIQAIIKPNQGHRSKSNAHFVDKFLDWIESQNFELNYLFGEPQLKESEDPECLSKCAEYRSNEADVDEEISHLC